MKRRLAQRLAAGSLVLCVASAAAWLRSHYASDLVFWTSADVSRSIYITTGEGGIGFALTTVNGRPGTSEIARAGFHWTTVRPPSGYARGWNHRHGFTFVRRGPYRVGFTVPFWLLCGTFAVAPALWTVARLRRRRAIRSGCCATCGYDLRATPGRCPECGTAAVAPSLPA